MRPIRNLLAALLLITASGTQAITLDYCLERAETNYPLVCQYGIIAKTGDISLSDINRGWLPRIGIYAQATAQNSVPGFPETLSNIISQMGQEIEGLGHVQYKAGVDLSQTIWDGGSSKAQRSIAQAETDRSLASVRTEIYAVRQKVTDIFFGILLMEEQIGQTENTLGLLKANLSLMQAMQKNGTAMASDVDMVEAQYLSMTQKLTEAKTALESYRRLLSIYIGEDLGETSLERPDAKIPADMESARPELEYFEAGKNLNLARKNAIDSSILPKIGLFAQAYYGYPGYNYFESMINRNLSFNILAGLKITWNIDSFYTRKNAINKLKLANRSIDNQREVFMFNTKLQTTAQNEKINGLREVMAEDSRIIELRGNVRRAAESQLRNGIIDTTALLAKITDENQALLMASYHEIQFIQTIYQLKNILNR